MPHRQTASPFYFTNANNVIVGNAASGGWAGYSFPMLTKPVKLHRSVTSFTPSSRMLQRFDSNTAHSSSYWWFSSGAIYFGGKLFHPDTSETLAYNPGRQNPARSTCIVEPCTINSACDCWAAYEAFTRLTNTKVFLLRGVGINHWGTRPELVGFEAHDVGLAASILGVGWLDNVLVQCRTGEPVEAPGYGAGSEVRLAYSWGGSGFEWYDTFQAHIVSNIKFIRCGVRQANHQSTDGCGDGRVGCHGRSYVWGMLAHSDTFVPEFMQVRTHHAYTNLGRRRSWNGVWAIRFGVLVLHAARQGVMSPSLGIPTTAST